MAAKLGELEKKGQKKTENTIKRQREGQRKIISQK